MVLKSRSYSTSAFRPTPLIWNSDEGDLVIIASSWGEQEHAQLVIDEISKYVVAAKSDVEVTSPFEYLPVLSPEVNYLRIGFQIANEVVYRTLNKNEYAAGVEVLALLRTHKMLAWAQVGQPSLYLGSRTGIEPIGVERNIGSNLPARILGVDSSLYIQCGSLTLKEDHQLVVLSGQSSCANFYSQASSVFSLDSLTSALVQSNERDPFWLGIINPHSGVA